MKKIFLLFLILAVLFALPGCGSPASSETPSSAATEAPAVPETTATPAGTTGQQGTTMAKQQTSPAPTAAAAATASSSSGSISTSANGYTIEALSAQKTKDYLGNDIILVKYRFTNSNSSSAAFWQATDQTVTQNGTKLSPDGIVCDDPDFMNSYAQISGGQSVICAYPYPYYSSDALSVKVSIYNYASGTTVSSASGTLSVG